jgi:hypothetical protein
MAKAISLAQPGDVIQLEPGSYGSLNITRSTGADSPKVVIRGDPNLADQQTCVESQAVWQSATPLCPHGNVLITGLNVCGHGISIQNMDTIGLNTTFYVGDNPCSATNDVADDYNIEIINSHFTFQSTLRGHDLLMSHTRIGPNEQICNPSHNGNDGDNLHIWPESHTTPWTSPYNITLDHNLIYDARLGDGSGSISGHGCTWGAHTDLVQTLGYNNLTVTNNIFWGSVDGIWEDGTVNGSTIGNAQFKNNFIGPSGIDGGGGTFHIGNADPGPNCDSGPYTIENNTFAINSSPQLVYCNGTAGTNSIIRNNYFQRHQLICHADGSYPDPQWSYNVFAPGNSPLCGTNTKVCTPTFQYTPANNSTEANFAHGWDLHLSPPDSCLKGAGDPINFSLTDIDGQSRVAGSIDAGADAITTGPGGGSGPSIGDLNSDTHVNITDLSILLSHYNQSAIQAQGDINQDGTVTILDLSILLSHYGI